MDRKQLVEEISKAILKDRQETYGSPEDSFTQIAYMWDLYMGMKQKINKLHATRIEAIDVAVMMALLKIVRSIKSPQHEDNWIDAAGYLICGGELATCNPVTTK